MNDHAHVKEKIKMLFSLALDELLQFLRYHFKNVACVRHIPLCGIFGMDTNRGISRLG